MSVSAAELTSAHQDLQCAIWKPFKARFKRVPHSSSQVDPLHVIDEALMSQHMVG